MKKSLKLLATVAVVGVAAAALSACASESQENVRDSRTTGVYRDGSQTSVDRREEYRQGNTQQYDRKAWDK